MADQKFASRPEHDSNSLLKERRVRIRYSANLRTLCQTDAAQVDDFWWSAKVRDISVSGLSLLTNRPFELETLLVVEPVLTSQQLVRSLPPARVVHASEQGDGGWVLGCQFTQTLNEQELQAVLQDG
jgi:hypothetical protein